MHPLFLDRRAGPMATNDWGRVRKGVVKEASTRMQADRGARLRRELGRPADVIEVAVRVEESHGLQTGPGQSPADPLSLVAGIHDHGLPRCLVRDDRAIALER